MKKGIFILLLGLFSINIGTAQSQNDELKQGFEQLSGEMERMFKDFEVLLNGEALMKLDSLDISSFGIDIDAIEKQFGDRDMNNLSMDDMMDLMRIQMDMLDQIDFSQFNQLFKDLGMDAPIIPSPDQRQQIQPPSNQKDKETKKGKKRKTYKM